MTGALIILALLIITGVILKSLDSLHNKKNSSRNTDPLQSSLPEDNDSGECCGQHLICEKTSLSPLDNHIEYFDDEELDAFINHPQDSFSDEDINQFRDILLSMDPKEVPAWTRSLQLRNVTIPFPIRDEIIMIAAELRSDS